MAVPRPILLALIGSLLLVATFMAAATTRNASSDQAAEPGGSAPAPTPAEPTASKGLAPPDALKSIAKPGSAIKSARFQVRLTAQELGGKRDRETISLNGAFKAGAPNALPAFSLIARESEAGRTTVSRSLSTGERAFLIKGDSAYEVPSLGIKGATKLREGIAKDAARAKAPIPGIDIASWVKDAKAADAAKLDGVDVTRVSGTIDPAKASANVLAIAKAMRTASVSEPLEIPRGLGSKVSRALKTTSVDAWVGTQDRIVRRLRVSVKGSFPKAMLEKGETPRWRMVLDARLSEVNKPQKFNAPDKVAKGLPKDGLGAKQAKASATTFTLGALYLDPPSGIAQTTAGLLRFGALERNARTSKAVERAIKANKRVVLFFHQSRGVDDPVIAASVARVKADRSAVVFADNVDNLPAYGRAISNVGVTRAPSVVIIGKSGKARLIEGYIDPAALAQEVADTR